MLTIELYLMNFNSNGIYETLSASDLVVIL